MNNTKVICLVNIFLTLQLLLKTLISPLSFVPASLLSKRGPSPRVKRQGLEADHSPPSNVEIQKGGAVPPLPHMSS
jgi:hypothetical protein